MPGTLNVGGHDIITHSGDAGAGDVTVNVQNRLVLDSSGNVGVGTSSNYTNAKLHIYAVNAGGDNSLRIQNASTTSGTTTSLKFTNTTSDYAHVSLIADRDRNLIFKNTNDTVETMRIDTSGNLLVGCTTSAFKFRVHNGTSTGILSRLGTNASTFTAIQFVKESSSDGSDNTGAEVGKITCTSTSTTYGTSSDYRLKENITEITDGISRVKQLNPSRFNFISDPDRTVDGFIAHEVSDVVPEAISGEKDAVNEDGSINPQGIDQSKLVPLLTAALQEAISKIEALTTRIEALENA